MTGLVSGTNAHRPHQLADRAPLPFFLVQLEHVANVDEAGDLVDGALVNGNPRVLLVDQQARRKSSSERPASMATMLGPRSHHLAHGLVAERHGGLDQLAVLLLDEALLGAGGDQRFDVFLGLAGFLGRLLGVASGPPRTGRTAAVATSGRMVRASGAERRDQRQDPAALGLAIEHLRNDVSRREHDQPGHARHASSMSLPGQAPVLRR